MLAIAAKHGHRIIFGQFVRYGLPTTVITIAISIGYLWIRYYALA